MRHLTLAVVCLALLGAASAQVPAPAPAPKTVPTVIPTVVSTPAPGHQALTPGPPVVVQAPANAPIQNVPGPQRAPIVVPAPAPATTPAPPTSPAAPGTAPPASPPAGVVPAPSQASPAQAPTAPAPVPIAPHVPAAAPVPAAPGPKGVPGPSGAPGTPGSNGTTGTPGAPGAQGTPGTPGTPGAAGVPGAAGTPGTPGTGGAGGAGGSGGAAGTPGTPGAPGTPAASANNSGTTAAGFPPLPQQTASPSPPPPANTPLPPPPPPTQCVVEPTCRLYVEDMECCQTEGLLTDKSSAFVWLLCTEQVTLPEGCMSVTGPVNNTVTPVFNGPSGYNFRHVVDWSTTTNSDGSIYTGSVSLDLQSQRTNASCALNIQPCLYNNVVYTTVDIVKDMNFTALSFDNFFDGYVGCPANNLDSLDSWGWINPGANNQCYEQQTQLLPAQFWQGGWVYYDQGYQIPCNATATLQSLENYHYTAPTTSAG